MNKKHRRYPLIAKIGTALQVIYPFEPEEERWAYWAKHIWFARYRTGALPLYKELLEVVLEKDYFVLTTNVDAQFEMAGFAAERIFATQGDYAFFQPASGEPKELYNNREWVERVLPKIRERPNHKDNLLNYVVISQFISSKRSLIAKCSFISLPLQNRLILRKCLPKFAYVKKK